MDATQAIEDAKRFMREGTNGPARAILLEVVSRTPPDSYERKVALDLLTTLPNVAHTDPWLPPELTWRQKYLNWKLVTVVVFLLLTSASTLIAQQQPMWLATFINLLLTFLLGFVADEWIQSGKTSGEVRQKALEISDRVDEEMRRMASELEQMVSTLGEIAIDPKHESLPKTTTYILKSLLRSMNNRLQEYALEVKKLQTVNQDESVKAKGEQIGEIRERTAQALKNCFPKIEMVEFFPEKPLDLSPHPQITIEASCTDGENIKA